LGELFRNPIGFASGEINGAVKRALGGRNDENIATRRVNLHNQAARLRIELNAQFHVSAVNLEKLASHDAFYFTLSHRCS
jgi:hypothetical protein